MKRWFLIVLTIFLLGAVSVFDYPLKVSWIEPVLNEDGTALEDLAKTTLYYRFDDKGVWIKIDDVPASNRFGGRSVSYNFQIILPNSQIEFIALTATCSDFSGNESKYAKVVYKQIDKSAPNPPSYIEVNLNYNN